MFRGDIDAPGYQGYNPEVGHLLDVLDVPSANAEIRNWKRSLV
jgi:hypothetical protein